MRIAGRNSLILVLVSLLIIACNGGEMEQQKIESNALKNVQPLLWENLSQKKIYFGHQSVGDNIVDGINDLIKENPQIKLNIVEINGIKDFSIGTFAHSKIGKNRDPASKFDAFEKLLGQIGGNIDIAFVKCCYVDIGAKADIEQIFDVYKKKMAQIKKKYPEIILVHFTVPLETSRIPFEFWLKIFKSAGWPYRTKMIRNIKKIWRYGANIKRNELSDLIKMEYGGKEPVFDIAEIESTYPDGSREAFTKKGNTYYSLLSEYTYDGGHLNEMGRKKVAEKLLIFLANHG